MKKAIKVKVKPISDDTLRFKIKVIADAKSEKELADFLDHFKKEVLERVKKYNFLSEL